MLPVRIRPDRPFSPALAGVLVAAALGLPGAAPSAADAASGAPVAQCGDAAYRKRCPRQCAPACQDDREFLLRFTDFCVELAVSGDSLRDTPGGCGTAPVAEPQRPTPASIAPVQDPPVSGGPSLATALGQPQPTPPQVTSPTPEQRPAAPGAPTNILPLPAQGSSVTPAPSDAGASTSPLHQCLDEAQRSGQTLEHKLKKLDELGQPDLVETLRPLLEGVPGCAPDAPSLIEMFRCLETEGADVATKVGEIGDRGYAAITDPKALCTIKRENLGNDYKLAKSLRDRTEALKGEFDRIRECKGKFEGWAQGLVEQQHQRDLRGGLLGNWINQIGADLDPAEKMALDLNNHLEQVKEQTASITNNIGIGLVICR